MKLLIFILLPIFSFGQSKLDTVTILSGKVKLLAPTELKPMTDVMWAAKYQQRPRPVMVLTDEDGEVNLIADMTKQPASENELASFKDFQIQQLKSSHPDMEVLGQGVKTVNGKKLAFIKFVSQAVDQKVFNYYFFTIANGNILLFSFNCIKKLQSKWEATADSIVASVKIK